MADDDQHRFDLVHRSAVGLSLNASLRVAGRVDGLSDRLLQRSRPAVLLLRVRLETPYARAFGLRSGLSKDDDPVDPPDHRIVSFRDQAAHPRFVDIVPAYGKVRAV